ncbi:TlpA family protein disulfide reductase [Desulfovibrio litoralis]|uniref:Thiol-disulfide isomerase or thioredoxin n=1 Tax=Desulfovibrio litoralis DSM 11393 TaxID=1121455 RepID=A0A1M7TBC2_9BACT|nr:TlpA disulfide reductase family protein [Desulfovibrio litoralis]SHN68032.1 Thiol-disulfide isomerase or thioredoxin [Desulfovibrio litoralis DSM 11393]
MQRVHKLSLTVFFVFMSILSISLMSYTKSFAAEPESMSLAQFDEALANSKGQVVLVNFFATWCPPCKAEIPVLQRLFAKHPANKLKVIALSVDEETEEVLPFMQKLGAKYPIFLAQNDLSEKWNLYAIPRLLIFDKSGKLVKDHEGMMSEQELNSLVEKYLGQ